MILYRFFTRVRILSKIWHHLTKLITWSFTCHNSRFVDWEIHQACIYCCQYTTPCRSRVRLSCERSSYTLFEIKLRVMIHLDDVDIWIHALSFRWITDDPFHGADIFHSNRYFFSLITRRLLFDKIRGKIFMTEKNFSWKRNCPFLQQRIFPIWVSERRTYTNFFWWISTFNFRDTISMKSRLLQNPFLTNISSLFVTLDH